MKEKLYTKGFTEYFLYSLLLLSIVLHKFYNLPNLSLFVLLIPMAFLPYERFGIKNKWNLSLLTLPFLYLVHPKDFLNLLLQAFAEELFFRAYLMQRFSTLIVSLLFTIPHVILYMNFFSFLTFFPSVFYCFAYQKTGSLVFVSLLHLGSNILWFKIWYFIAIF